MPTPAEEALEEARDAFHADRVKKGKNDPAIKEAFKAAQEAVRAERLEERGNREAEPAPPEAEEVIRDVTGTVFGWTTGSGDAVVAQGGRAG